MAKAVEQHHTHQVRHLLGLASCVDVGHLVGENHQQVGLGEPALIEKRGIQHDEGTLHLFAINRKGMGAPLGHSVDLVGPHDEHINASIQWTLNQQRIPQGDENSTNDFSSPGIGFFVKKPKKELRSRRGSLILGGEIAR